MGLTKLGAGTLTLSGENTYSGATKINEGTLSLAGENALRYSTLDYNDYGGGLSFGAQTYAALGGLKGSQNLSLTNTNSSAVTLYIGYNNESTTYSGALSGSGKLHKYGSGTLTLSGANTYTGDTRISSGTLHATTPAALPGWESNVQYKITCSSSTLAVSAGGANEWNAEQIKILLHNVDFQGESSRLGIDTTNAAAGCFTYGETIDGKLGITKLGTGTLVLSGENRYLGNTTVNNGTLRLANSNTVQDSTVDLVSGNLSFGDLSSATLGGLSGNQNISLNNNSLNGVSLSIGKNNKNTTYSGNLDGTGTLRKIGTGTLVLSGINTYTGGTTVIAGILQAKTVNSFAEYSSPGKILVNDGGTLAVNVGGENEWTTTDIGALLTNVNFMPGSAIGIDTTNADSGGFTYSETLQGYRGLTKLGQKTLILTGANSYTGKTTISGGITGTGTLQFGDGISSNGIGPEGIGDIENCLGSA